MSEWRECKLGDVIKTNVNSLTSSYPFKEILYLDTGSITSGKLDSYHELLLEEAPSRAKRLVKNGDIVYSTVRPIQRHYGYIKEPPNNLVVSTGFTVIETINELSDSKFIYYLLSSNDIVDLLDSIAEGSTSAYPSLKPSDIENLEIFLPPLPEQKAIAGVLSSLDDKIDLLHRQNKTLEAMAETLFRQWFVEEVDEGWEEKPLSFFGKIVCGKTPSKAVGHYFGGHIPFIKIPDMHGNVFIFYTSDTLTEEGKLSQDNKTLPPKSICVSCIATVGLVSLSIIESQTNQQINSIIPNMNHFRYYLYLTMKTSYDLIQTMASGGTATYNLNTSDFSNILISYPEEKLLITFHSEVEHLFDKIYNNQTQIRSLEKLRDTLLPKLMSGEVRVET